MTIGSGEELIDADLAELCTAGAAIRDATTGNRITYSPKVFIPLTMLCQDRCGYCTFAKAPALLRSTPTRSHTGAVAEVLDGVQRGHEVGFDEIVTLFSARGAEVHDVAMVADELRQQIASIRRSPTSPRRHRPCSMRPDCSPT